jgi:hypothetical protein
MNAIDHQVKPLIVPLIRNRRCEITDDDCLALSRWSMKIGLLLEHTLRRSDLTRRRSLTPPRAHAEFHHTRLPPPETRIWMWMAATGGVSLRTASDEP